VEVDFFIKPLEEFPVPDKDPEPMLPPPDEPPELPPEEPLELPPDIGGTTTIGADWVVAETEFDCALAFPEPSLAETV
jgi:hypothetical protein